MTNNLADLVGQSMMLSFAGPRVTPDVRAALARIRPAGVILFAGNILSPAALHALCSDLQAAAAALGLPPLLIAIDQEGGIVSRLPAPFTTTPGAMAQAATGDPDAARACARITGRQLRACGVNTNFAPVLDVNCNPANPVIGTRSFGADADIVTRFGLAALEGYRQAGVIATIKHFPGHGDASVDSHAGLPAAHHDRARLDAVELAPFKAAIAAGAPALMSAHMVFSALDTLPATLSPAILTELLRGELGFDGLVFTDALDMGAIARSYGPAEAAILAKAAGADVLLPLGDLDSQSAVATALCEAVQGGRLAADAFAATRRRLAKLRMAYAIDHTLPPFAAPDPADEQIALSIARRGVRVCDAQGILPLPAGTRLALIDCTLPRFSLVEEAAERSALLRQLVAGAFPRATCMALPREWDAAADAQVLALVRASAAVLLVTRNAGFVEQQADLARRLAALDAPLVHAAVRNPDAQALGVAAAATVLTYGDPPVALRALVEVLREGVTR
jgi:beta-N-acetylhexosaminidase